ncbi:MAG: hypothetical protein ACREVL_00950 [Solimonas sp.]
MSYRPLILAALILACATAQAQQQTQKSGKPPAPPPEAYTACAGRNAGDMVSFTTREHTIEGTCEMIGGKLALRPSKPPQDGRAELPNSGNSTPPQ